MQAQIDNRDVDQLEVAPEFTAIGHDMLIGTTQWRDGDGVPQRRYQVLTIRDDKIADMQVCGTWRQAKRFATRAQR